MDPLQFVSAARLLVVAGKGGVGKTTVTASIARAAADAGRSVLAVELDEKPALAELLPDVAVQTITAPGALAEYLQEHGFGRLVRRLRSSGVVDVVSTAAPGIDDLVVLGKLKQLERAGGHDLIVVDGPAAGHAVTFLLAASALLGAVRSGPIHDQAAAVATMLADPSRCAVVLVTIPEATPVNEVVETAYALEERVGVALAAVVVNGVDEGAALPDPTALVAQGGARSGGTPAEHDAMVEAVAFRRRRRAVQGREIDRLTGMLALPQLHLPQLPTARLDASGVAELATVLAARAAGLAA